MSLDKVVSANTRFGFELFAELAREDAGKNVFISPASVSIALTMLYNGAVGETREAMANTLALQGMSLEEINRANAALMEALRGADPEVRLAIANSLWAAADAAFRSSFVQRNRAFYDAEVRAVDFDDPATLAQINGWVKEKTEGKIEEILSRLDPLTLLVLINAIYFKGKWVEPFDEERTEERPFTLLDGSQKQHPMMSRFGSYRYYRGEGFQAVRLPYGQGRVSMYVFLPDRGVGLEAFQRRLTAENWDGWMARFREMEGRVVLPRFKLSYGKTLNEALQVLGMGIAFEGRADFSDMCAERAWISLVIHKTFVEVNEEGTEAAAATAVMMVMAVMAPQETFEMIVDRPFFCAIRDDETGALLFMGAIVDPDPA